MRTPRRWNLGAATLLGLAATGCGQNDAVAPPAEPVPSGDGNLGLNGASSGVTSGGGETSAPSSGATSGGGSDEVCGNGLDDDGNGNADDGCPCELGAEQPCFLGSAPRAGQGACVMGKQL
ncbi:MAG: hypothetical protein FJ096_11850 [Deltaproteobacteria bacterium]|nr:hypothetical protein [Deltaproteobacteria bacterium]